MSNSQPHEYTFPTGLDPSVSAFFSNHNVNEWTFEKYKEFCLHDNPTTQMNSIITHYQDNLIKIINNKDVPINIKGKAGNLRASIKGKATEKHSPQNVYNVNIKTNHGTIYGDVFNNNDPYRSDKRQKTDHINDKSSDWKINKQEDVWEAVRQYLEASITHDFCLEKSHIIQCGYSIKCDPSIPDELWAYFKDDEYTISTPFQSCSRYTTSVLSAMKKNELKAIQKVIRSLEAADDIPSKKQTFVEEFFHVCLYIYRKPNLYERLSVNETGFNHSFIWLVMEFVIDSIPDMPLKLYPAEYILKCSKEEYKTDACILLEEDELSILETSGKILLDDNSKYGSDHIKVHYGALSIFNSLYKKYCWASEAAALKLQVPFLHARHDQIHLWSLELCSSELYCSKRIFKTKVPKSMADSQDILSLGNLSWSYRRLLEGATRVVKMMKEEHEEYLLQKVLSNEAESRTSLSTLLKLDIQKPVKGPGYSLLLPEENDEEQSVKYSEAK
ncbi:hypothetical protein A0J61_06719 [Choanephora cucurbitarum]|uniref:Uncharacterized protein n=1 Tax=Choanephora cucurbitarum TaxID=101091 RepID=A0A1C7N7Y5_9FUNG|nr:hypothetical protein A0J61_06719 [Choanephora cucurbitarum]